MPKLLVSHQEYIERKLIPVTECGCWIWLGTLSVGGYGMVGVNGKTECVHRMMWQFYNGPIPDGLFVLHKCDIRCCANPDHLFVGTHADNMADRDAKGRNKPRPGILNPKAKLSPVEVLAIRGSSLGCGRLARQYGMSKSTMARIRSGKYWSHI